MIRFRFECLSVTRTAGLREIVEIDLVGDNPDGSQVTGAEVAFDPKGHFSIMINDPARQGKMEPGQFYYLDIARVP